jgi:ABC-type bacteriocin/lantibiotic exporter with double-glycine peptidase domain
MLYFAGVSLSDDGAPTPPTSSPTDSWRTRQVCGLNACYTFLKLQGCNVDYQTLKKDIPSQKNGSKLVDLLKATHRRGLSTTLVRCNIVQLSRVPLPAIAHLEQESTSVFFPSERGHYVVLVALRSGGQIEYIDGSTGRLLTMPLGKFFRDWSGYLLIADTSFDLTTWITIIVVCLAMTAVGISYFARARARKLARAVVS